MGSDIELIGETGGPEKDAFLRNAAALLFPIDWPEPFGLVMIEALACGTPVLAFGRGSVCEVIQDGVTGFVRETEDQLVEAVSKLGDIRRAACRRDVEQRFSPRAMARAYEAIYERLVEAGPKSRIIDLGHLAANYTNGRLASGSRVN
jgi:glycosyltransferase involved in cell wall biosynthesis